MMAGKHWLVVAVLLQWSEVSVAVTATETITLTLESATTTVTLETVSPTTSSSLSVSKTPSESVTETLDTSTESPTETQTSTNSFSKSASGSATLTLPSSTYTTTESVSVSLGSLSATASLSMSVPTASQTVTTSATVPLTGTSTASISVSVPTVSSTVPATGTLTSSFSSTLLSYTNYSMAVEPAGFFEGQEVRVKVTSFFGEHETPAFNTTAKGTLLLHVYSYVPSRHVDCGGYSSADTPFQVYSTASPEDSFHSLATSVLFTVVAPAAGTPFVICFKHQSSNVLNAPRMAGAWHVVTQDGKGVLEANPSSLRYDIRDATVMQYAVLQLVAMEGWNFTYAGSACAGDAALCGWGDNIKIVHKGTPCTYENIYGENYYGSSEVGWDGVWRSNAVQGLFAGATEGGVGAFGTQYANPFVDEWEWWGTSNETRTAYAYIQFPPTPGSYELCFSSREQRISWKAQNVTVASLPLWRKLYSRSGATSFTVAAESLSWLMRDLTPSTYGELVVIDLHSSLSRLPSVWTSSYWAALGGDDLKVVSSSVFEKKRKGGSFPSAGCWSRAAVHHRAFDLYGDPTVDTENHDQQNAHSAFATLRVPPSKLTTWFICYRRTHVPSSGYRVLPFTTSPLATWEPPVPYPYPYALISGGFNTSLPYDVPSWHMNDTREATWGLLTLEGRGLDPSPWSFWTLNGKMVNRTTGTAVQLTTGVCGEGSGFVVYGAWLGQQETAYYMVVPEEGVYKVCVRTKAWNWQLLGDVTVLPDPLRNGLSIEYMEHRTDREALFIITDTHTSLSTQDRLRLAPVGQNCNWGQEPALTTYVSLYCPVKGSGYPNMSGLFTDGLCLMAGHVSGVEQTRHAIDIYDDIVPGDEVVYGSQFVAGVIPLLEGQEDTYQICYKQISTPNWVIFNSSYTVTSSPRVTVTPLPSVTLLGGSLQTFTITDAAAEDGTVVFTKLALTTGSVRDSCVNLPGGTERTPYSAVDTTAMLRNVAKATLVVPHLEGRYMFCIQIRSAEQDSLSWVRRDYHVVDNGVRWYVGAGSKPVNQGLSVVRFVWCKVVNGVCRTDEDTRSFDTNKGADAGKIISMSSRCSAGSESIHVGLEGGGSAGVTDLGPANGPSDVAEMHVTFPPTPHDAPATYKICMKTTHPHLSVKPHWVEVQQTFGVFGQRFLEDGLRTVAGLFKSWTVSASLSPYKTLFTGPSQKTTALGGASTKYVSNPTGQAPGHAIGFTFNSYKNLDAAQRTENLFKLVRAASPSRGFSENAWGNTSNWERISADCLGPAVDAASNTGACSGEKCPKLIDISPGVVTEARDAVFHIPQPVGMYFVCYKVSHSSLVEETPWLWLPAEGTTEYALYSHPTFLEMDASDAADNVTVYDLRVVEQAGIQTPVSSWCDTTEGVPCSTENQALTADMLIIVNDSQVCPVPSSMGYPWYPLSRATNTTIKVQNTSGSPFVLPPVNPTPSGLYKMCVYKAGEPSAANFGSLAEQHIIRRGVVYQLYNRGIVAAGGGTAYWRRDTEISLKVTSDLWYNSSLRFMEYRSTLQSTHGPNSVPSELVIDEDSGRVARTPVIHAGSVVTYVVQAQTDSGAVVPTEMYAVDVMICDATRGDWGRLGCGKQAQTPPGTDGQFHIQNTNGVCQPHMARRYGWFASGLRQFMVEGEVTFALQYTSRCPQDEFGCGVRFKIAGSETYSPSQWVTVSEHPPTSITIDGQFVDPEEAPPVDICKPSGETLCFKKACKDGTRCSITLTAMRHGVEYAPNGTLELLYAAQDYPGWNRVRLEPPDQVRHFLGSTISSGAAIFSGEWSIGGAITFHITPVLQNDASTTLFLNATYGSPLTWTRFAIDIIKAVPASVEVASVLARDTVQTRGRTLVPAMLRDEAKRGFTACEGCYLEALVPYTLRFVVKDNTGDVLTSSMLGWLVTGSIVESSNSLVLNRSEGYEYTTEPDLLAASVLREGLSDLHEVVFRLYVVDNACSRFSTTGGCGVLFHFAHANHGEITTSLRTPVRVPASTLHIESVAVSTVLQGITVVAYPGSFIVSGRTETFVYDEHHYGSVFVLLTDSAMGVGLYGNSSGQHELTRIGDNRWGASWTIKPTRPCFRCELTFHTTLGAGPDTYLLHRRGAYRGFATLTWNTDDVKLTCPTQTSAVNRAFSLRSVITVANYTVGVQSEVHYPKWWVYVDTSMADIPSGYTVLPSAVLSAQVQPDGVAYLPKMHVEGPIPTPSVMVKLPVKAIGYAYDGSVAGSVRTGSVTYSCVVSIVVTPVPASHTASLVKVDNAQPLCSSRSACMDWKATPTDLHTGVAFTVDLTDATASNSTLKFNDTQAPPWVSQSTSDTFQLNSEFSPATYEGYTYSFGSLSVMATRSLTSGNHRVIIRYATAGDETPMRKTVFRICDSSWSVSEGTELPGVVCTAPISLWVVAAGSPKVAIVAEPLHTEQVRGTAVCRSGATQMILQALVYIGTGTTRYVIYDSSVVYSLKAAGDAQRFAKVGDAAIALTLQVVPLTSPSLTHSLSLDDLTATFTFYGVDLLATPTNLQLTAFLDSQQFTISTATSYTWTDITETYGQWDLGDAVSLDTECPSRRHLQSSVANYKSHQEKIPGKGWMYSREAVAGIPFPIETVVRTTSGERAWTFSERVRVKVSKRSWKGCNDGGALSVYSMPASNAAKAAEAVTGDVSKWVLERDHTVPTSMGAAIPWVVLSAECQSCSLQLDLCFTGTDAASCLSEVVSSTPSDVTPIFPDRTRVTKQFSVVNDKNRAVEVVAQTVPSGGHSVYVGEIFTLAVKSAVTFGAAKWTFLDTRNWTRTIYARTVWRPTLRASSVLRYGNGGFLSEPVTVHSTGCNAAPTPQEFRDSSSHLLLSESRAGEISFFFARTCYDCQVWFDYTLSGPGFASGSFPLREHVPHTANGLLAVGPPLLLTVKTCGTSWLLSGTPPAAVRKRRPFSLTALWVDPYKMASWEGAGVVRVSWSGVGNGEGGRPEITSQKVSGTNEVQSTEGSATVRMEHSRACYVCTVLLSGAEHKYTVLTDATQIMVMPVNTTSSLQWARDNTNGTWSYMLYAADDLGDRSYATGGPTLQAFHPLYNTFGKDSGGPTRMPKRLSLTHDANHTEYEVIHNNTASRVVMGTPQPVVINGSWCFNGIPVYNPQGNLGTPGIVTLEISNSSPGVGHALHFAIEGVAGLATVYNGEKRPPVIHWSPQPDDVVVTDPAVGCANISTEQSCVLTVHAVRSQVNSTTLQQTMYTGGAINTTAACTNSCAVVEAAPAGDGLLRDGIARVWVNLTTPPSTNAECTCTVTVTPPVEIGSDLQVVQVNVTKTVPTSWIWGSTTLYAVEGVTAPVVFYPVGGAGDAGWGSPPELTYDATGCFTCTDGEHGLCRVTLHNKTATVEGTFTESGVCRFSVNSFRGFPGGGGLLAGVDVVVQERKGFEMVGSFGGLTAYTEDGEPAAYRDAGATLVLRVFDAAGNTVVGDQWAMLTLNWAAAGGGTLNKSAENGFVTFNIHPLQTTRNSTCDSLGITCPHIPITFSIIGWENLVINNIGPLRVINSAKYLVLGCKFRQVLPAVCTPNTGRWRPCTHSSHLPSTQYPAVNELITAGYVPVNIQTVFSNVQINRAHLDISEAMFSVWNARGMVPSLATWSVGYPFDIRVVAIDAQGEMVTHHEDTGSSITLKLNLMGIPCANIDRSFGGAWVEHSCVANKPCEMQKLDEVEECTPGGLSIPEILKLSGGQREIKQVIVTDALEGSQRGIMSTMEMASGVYVAAFSVNFVTMVGIIPVTNDTVCDLGARPVECSVSMVVRPLTPFEIPVQAVGLHGASVTADSTSRFLVEGKCLDHGVSNAVLGIWRDGKGGGEGQLDFLHPIIFYLQNGAADLADIQVTSDCENMTLIFTCISGDSDTKGTCNGTTTIVRFSVETVPGRETPAPAPKPFPFELSLGGFNETEANAFSTGIDAAAFEDSMLQLLKADASLPLLVKEVALTHVCNIQSSGPIGSAGCRAVRTGSVLQAIHVVVALFEVIVQFNNFLVTEEILLKKVVATVQDDLAAPGSVLRATGGSVFTFANPASMASSIPITPAPTAVPSISPSTPHPLTVVPTQSPPRDTPGPPSFAPSLAPSLTPTPSPPSAPIDSSTIPHPSLFLLLLSVMFVLLKE